MSESDGKIVFATHCTKQMSVKCKDYFMNNLGTNCMNPLIVSSSSEGLFAGMHGSSTFVLSQKNRTSDSEAPCMQKEGHLTETFRNHMELSVAGLHVTVGAVSTQGEHLLGR